MKKRLVIVGGRGSGQIAMTVFEEANRLTRAWRIEGYLNDIVPVGGRFGGYPVLGGSEEAPEFVRKGYYLHYALHFNAKDKHERVKRFLGFGIPLEANASAVHPWAYVNPETKIGYGVVICPFAATSFGPTIGNFVHIYSAALIGHDAVIGDYCTVGAHGVVGGRVEVREGAHVGLNSCLREDITVGRYSIVGMGSVVVKDTKDFSVVAGNPARQIGSVRP